MSNLFNSTEVRLLSSREQARLIRNEALSILEKVNEFSSTSRRVGKRAAYKVISRSLSKTNGLPFSIRKYQALSELSEYISLAKYNKVNRFKAFNTDLLPVSHPRSTKLTTMTASAILEAQMRWVIDDPQITDDSVKSLIASAMMSHPDSPEHIYSMKRIELLPQGTVPLEALVAAYGDGNSRAARSARARLQRRDRKGRFAEMFGTFKLIFGLRDGGKASATGRILGQNIFSPDLLDMELPDGRIAAVPISQGEQPEGMLDDVSPEAREKGFVRASDIDIDSNAPVVGEDSIAYMDAPSGFREDKEHKGLGKKYTDEAFDVTVFDGPSPQTRDLIDAAIKRSRDLDLDDPRQIKLGEDGKLWDPDRKLFAVNRRGEKTQFAFAQNWKDALEETRRKEKLDEQEQFEQGEDEETSPLADQLKGSPDKKSKKKEKARLSEKGFNYNIPKGSLELDPNYDYIPEGTEDDPSMLSAMQSEDDLQSGLVDALDPVSATKPATGLGRLEDENGEEFEVPAEAILSAIGEQGGDKEMALAKAYDTINNNSDNEKSLEANRKKTKKDKATEPKKLDEIFDEVVSEEPEKPIADILEADEEISEDPATKKEETLENINDTPALEGLSREEQEQIASTGDYRSFIPKNEDINFPEGMYKPNESNAEDREEALKLAAAKNMPNNNLIEGLQDAIKNGGKSDVLSFDENGELVPTPISAEAWRDAVALRGRDANKILKEIADGSLDLDKEKKEDESNAKKKQKAAAKKWQKRRDDLIKDLGIEKDSWNESDIVRPIERAQNLFGDDPAYEQNINELIESYKSFLEGKDLNKYDDAEAGLKDFKEAVDGITEEDEDYKKLVDAVSEAVVESLASIAEWRKRNPEAGGDEPETEEEEEQSEEKPLREREEEEFSKYAPLPEKLPEGWNKTKGSYNELYYMPEIENEDGTRIIGTYGKDGEKDTYWSIMDAPFDVPDKFYKTSEEALADYKKYKAKANKGIAEGVPPTKPPVEEPPIGEEPQKKIVKYKRVGKRTLLRDGKGVPIRSNKELADFLIENGFEFSKTVERDGVVRQVNAHTALQDDEEFKAFARELRDRFNLDLQPQPATPNAPAQEPIDFDAPTPEIEPVGKPEPVAKLPEKIKPVGEIPEPEIIEVKEEEQEAPDAGAPPPPPPNLSPRFLQSLLRAVREGRVDGQGFPRNILTDDENNFIQELMGKKVLDQEQMVLDAMKRLDIEPEEQTTEESTPEVEPTPVPEVEAPNQAVEEVLGDSLTSDEEVTLDGLLDKIKNKLKEKGEERFGKPEEKSPFGSRKDMISKLMWFKWGAGAYKNESTYIQMAMKDYKKKLEGLSDQDMIDMLNLYYDEMDAIIAEQNEQTERNRQLAEARAKKRKEREDNLLEESQEKSEETPTDEETPAVAEEKPLPLSAKAKEVLKALVDRRRKIQRKIDKADLSETATPAQKKALKDELDEITKIIDEIVLGEKSADPAETPATPDPEIISKPVKTQKMSALTSQLRPGDVTAEDYFTITNIEPGFTKDKDRVEVPASRITGYYPGSVEQSTKLWADDAKIPIYRGVTPPAKGDLPELSKPEMKLFGDGRLEPVGETPDGRKIWELRDKAAQAEYESKLAEYKEELASRMATWQVPEVEEEETPTFTPKNTLHVVRALGKDLKPNDIAFRRDGDELSEFFVIEEVLQGTVMVERADGKPAEEKVQIRGYYPGHESQIKSWKVGTEVEVLRGENPENIPAKGDKPAIDSIEPGTLKGKAYKDKNAEISAARKEAGKAYTPNIKSVEIPKVLINRPSDWDKGNRPAFIGSAAEIANLKDGAAIWEALKGKRIVYIDFETIGKGFDSDNPDQPIQVAAAVFENGEKVDEINLFINPGVPLDDYYYSQGKGKNKKPYLDKDGNRALNPERVIDNNGTKVDDAFLATQPSIEEQLRKFAELLGKDAILVAHNAEFDTNLFEKWAQKLGIDYKFSGVIDTLELARTFGFRGNDLETVAKRYGIEKDPSFWHNAAADSEVLPEILEKLLKDAQPDNPQFSPEDRMLEFNAKRAKWLQDMADFKQQETELAMATAVKDTLAGKPVSVESLVEKPEASFGPDGSTESADEHQFESIFGGIITNSWIEDDENTFIVDEGRAAVRDIKIGDFVPAKEGGYHEVIDLLPDPEDPNGTIVVRRIIASGDPYSTRVTDKKSPGIGWANGKVLEGTLRRRNELSGKTPAEIRKLIEKPKVVDPVPTVKPKTSVPKGAKTATADEVQGVASDAIETITSGAKSDSSVEEAIKGLTLDDTTKSLVLENRTDGSVYHLSASGVPLKVGDKVRGTKTGRLGEVKSLITTYGSRGYKNYVKVKFDDATKRENISAGSLEVINFDDGSGFFAPDKPNRQSEKNSVRTLPLGENPNLQKMGMVPLNIEPPIDGVVGPDGDFNPDFVVDDPTKEPKTLKPSEQQKAITAAIADGKDVVVQALAGTGKTTTLKMAARAVAEKNPEKTILYVAFGRSVADELNADPDRPKNLIARSDTQVAWHHSPKWLQDRGFDRSTISYNTDTAKYLGIQPTKVTMIKKDGTKVDVEMSTLETLSEIKKALTQFTQSADEKVMPKHFQENIVDVPKSLIDIANAWWDDISNPKGRLSVTQNFFSKYVQLNGIDVSKASLTESAQKIPASDIIFFDEAQDINDVTASWIRNQKMQKVFVGDGNQSIYMFRGAKNQLETLEGAEVLQLTESYRFGSNIAAVANRFLAFNGKTEKVIGLSKDQGEIVSTEDMTDPNAVLVRTNGGALKAMEKYLEEGKTVGISESLNARVIEALETINWLKGGKSGDKPENYNSEIGNYDSFEELSAEVVAGKAPGIRSLYDLYVQNGPENLRELLKRVVVQEEDTEESKAAKLTYSPITIDQAEDGSKGILSRDVSYKIVGDSIILDTKFIKNEYYRNLLNSNLRKVGMGAKKTGEKIKNAKGEIKDVYVREVSIPDALDRTDKLNQIKRILNGIVDPVIPDVVVTTGHVSKGDEWDNILIWEDFEYFGPRESKETPGEMKMPEEQEVNLAYVAVTRAKKRIALGPLTWVYDYTEESDEQVPIQPSNLQAMTNISTDPTPVTPEEFDNEVKETAKKADPATQRIADAIIAALEAGTAPWRKPWTGGGFLPTSVATGKMYEGSNVISLWAAQEANGWTDNRWLTYAHAVKLGGFIKKDSKATSVIHWTPKFKKVEQPDGTIKEVFVYTPPKIINLFNVEQAEGIDLPPLVRGEPIPVSQAEQTLLDTFKNRPEIFYKSQDSAYYSPITDTIHLPLREQFGAEQDLFETLVHELAHSTGHTSRVNRKDLTDNYGTHKASRGEEELIAEISVALVAARLGVEIDFGNVAAYAKSWLGALKDDPTMIIKAAKQAQRAVDHMLGKQEEPAKVDEEGNSIEPVGEGVGSEGRTGEEIANDAELKQEPDPEPNVGNQGKTGEEISSAAKTPKNIDPNKTAEKVKYGSKMHTVWNDVTYDSERKSNPRIEGGSGVMFKRIMDKQEVISDEAEVGKYVTDILNKYGYGDRTFNLSMATSDEFFAQNPEHSDVEAAVSRGVTEELPDSHPFKNKDIPVLLVRSRGTTKIALLHEIAHMMEANWKNPNGDDGHNAVWFATWLTLLRSEGFTQQANLLEMAVGKLDEGDTGVINP